MGERTREITKEGARGRHRYGGRGIGEKEGERC